MKNQYVGDIGDYGKYGLLRFMAAHGIKIGVNWYRTENDGSADGKITSYLKQDSERIYDPELFDALKKIDNRSDKNVKMIEQDTHQIIVIGVAASVPHNAMADSLMDDISLFVEENTEAEIIEEEREIR